MQQIQCWILWALGGCFSYEFWVAHNTSALAIGNITSLPTLCSITPEQQGLQPTSFAAK